VTGRYEPEARNKAVAAMKVTSKTKNKIGRAVRFKILSRWWKNGLMGDKK
jgi:hypothetical protein